ncbi:MAG: DegQ family serine endoprotease [Rhodospirillaceae bacterium]|nr:DegQ family serine endoprotease [Rhodospirillaceae bacterium]
MTGKARRRLTAALLATTALAGAFVVASPWSHHPAWAERTATEAVATPAPALLPGSFAQIVEGAMPAVVNVSVTHDAPQMVTQQWPGPDLRGTPFDDLLRRFHQGMPEGPQQGPMQGLGTGFIIDADGLIVTNNHVVDGADKVMVTLSDGQELPATVVGTDPHTDLALLRVEAGEPLPFVAFGDSDAAHVGDWVVSIGDPFGLGGSVTAGIISARNRDINAGPYDDYLQIDAAINRGNSGGPTFNLSGEVIGINTAIFSPNGGSVGIGFAIPSNMARPILEQLAETGVVTRGWLGVSVQEVTPDIAEALGLDQPAGALVSTVFPDAPAAGVLESGDVVLSFNGQDIGNVDDLPRIVAQASPESTAQMQIWRDGETETVDVTLGKRPDTTSVASIGERAPSEDMGLGLSVMPLDPGIRDRLGLSSDVEGALVAKVVQGSAAERAGIAEGDVILRVGDQAITDHRQIAAAMADAASDGRASVLVQVLRQGQERFVALPLDSAAG